MLAYRTEIISVASVGITAPLATSQSRCQDFRLQKYCTPDILTHPKLTAFLFLS